MSLSRCALVLIVFLSAGTALAQMDSAVQLRIYRGDLQSRVAFSYYGRYEQLGVIELGRLHVDDANAEIVISIVQAVSEMLSLLTPFIGPSGLAIEYFGADIAFILYYKDIILFPVNSASLLDRLRSLADDRFDRSAAARFPRSGVPLGPGLRSVGDGEMEIDQASPADKVIISFNGSSGDPAEVGHFSSLPLPAVEPVIRGYVDPLGQPAEGVSFRTVRGIDLLPAIEAVGPYSPRLNARFALDLIVYPKRMPRGTYPIVFAAKENHCGSCLSTAFYGTFTIRNSCLERNFGMKEDGSCVACREINFRDPITNACRPCSGGSIPDPATNRTSCIACAQRQISRVDPRTGMAVCHDCAGNEIVNHALNACVLNGCFASQVGGPDAAIIPLGTRLADCTCKGQFDPDGLLTSSGWDCPCGPDRIVGGGGTCTPCGRGLEPAGDITRVCETSTQHPPEGAVSANCTTVSGWVRDLDTTDPIDVEIYDGPRPIDLTTTTTRLLARIHVPAAATPHQRRPFTYTAPLNVLYSGIHRLFVYAKNAGRFAGDRAWDTLLNPTQPLAFSCINPEMVQGRLVAIRGDELHGIPATASGWALLPRNTAAVQNVLFYVDRTSGTPDGQMSANEFEPALLDGPYAMSTRHRFSWPIPARFRDGRPHTLIVYALDVDGRPRRLENAPMTFTLAPPPPSLN